MEPQKEKIQEKEVYKNIENSYEEISEKKTSKLGYILLMFMVFFVIGVGETIFSDLQKILPVPVAPSYCISDTINNFENLAYLPCNFSNYRGSFGFNEIDSKFGLDTKYSAIEPELSKIADLNEQINSNNSNISTLESSVQGLNSDYDLSLQEKMANEEAIIGVSEIKTQILSSRSQIESLRNEIARLQEELSPITSNLIGPIQSLGRSYDQANEDYLNTVAWYGFKIFLLRLAFIFPFFLLSLYYYFRLKRKNSPYTIILTAVMTAFSILFLQVVGAFLYGILPREWFARIFEIFLSVPFLRYVIYYGSVILVIGLFGGIVYYIQKNVYSPVKVAIRRLKKKECPSCSFPMNPDHSFCPECGLSLKEKCESCGNLKIRYLTHCPSCGKE